MGLPTIGELKDRVRKTLNTPLSPRMARVNNYLEDSYQKVTRPINSFLSGINTHPLSSRVENPALKIAAGIVETPYTALTSVPKTYGQTLNEINSGQIFTPQGVQRTAGRVATSALDTMSGGLLKRGINAIGTAQNAVSSASPQALKTLITTGAKSGLKTGVGYGSGYGFGSAMEQNGRRNDVISEMLKQGAIGGLLGGALGGGIPAIAGGIKALKSSPELRQNALSQIGDSMPPIGMSIKNVSNEPKIDDFPMLSGRTPIAGVNDTRPSALKSAKKKTKVPIGEQELNVNNLNLSQEQKMEVAAITGGKKKGRMTNKSVSELSDSVGTNMSAPGIDYTRQIAAEQLNTRRKVVSLEKDFDQMRLNGASFEDQLKRIQEIDSVGTAAQAQGTHEARVLAARAIMADESKTPMQRVFGMMREAGVPSEKYTKAAVGVDFKDANAVAKFYRSMVPAKASEWLDALRYSSMLSSPITHAVNISSNFAGTGFVRPIVKTLTGGVDFIRAAMTGTKQTQFAGEGLAHAKGYWSNVGNGWGKFVDTMSGKQSIDNIDYSQMPLAPGSKTAATLNFPMKLLEGMDQFFMAMTEGGETSALKYRQGKGVKVRNLAEQATLEAQKSVFRQKLGGEGNGALNDLIDYFPIKVLEARNSPKPLVRFLGKWTFPFIGTPTNILKQGAEFTPGLGALNLIGGANKSEILAKQAFGAATFLGAASLFASGKTTGAEPTNQKQKNEFRAAGMQPYSVKIGDTWYSYSKLHPAIAFPLALVAMVHDAQENKKIDDDGVSMLVKTVAKYGGFFADQSYMKSMGGFLDSVKGGESAIQSQISNYWLQVVPFRALGGWIARMIDDVQRKVDPSATFLEKQGQLLMMNLPLLSQNVPARLDGQGNPIPAQHPFINSISPMRISTENPQMKDFYDTHQSVLKQGRQEQQIKEILNRGGKLPEGISQEQTTSGNGEIVPMNGEFYAKIGKRGFVKFNSEEEAQQAINRDKFESSGKPVEVIDGMVYRRGKNGKSLPPVLLTDYEERVYTAQLTQAKDTNDFHSWVLTARDRYRNLNEQLNDPTLDDLDKLEIQNKINGLVKQAALYSRYGGFKKPKSYKGKAIKFKTSFKSGSSKSLGATKPIKPAPFKPLNFSAPNVDVKPYKLK